MIYLGTVLAWGDFGGVDMAKEKPREVRESQEEYLQISRFIDEGNPNNHDWEDLAVLDQDVDAHAGKLVEV